MVPLIVTAPVARKYTGPLIFRPDNRNVAPDAMLIVVKLKIFFATPVPVYCVGSKVVVVGIFSAPSEPSDVEL